ncbi:Uncharacterised protein [Mycobacterium tuberculosis]|nr:Uncharacterised protein [Mycobacterium tuberculosis]
MAHHSGGVLAGGQRTQSGYRLGTVTGHHRAELGLPRSVVIEGVGHVGQGHVSAGPFHPIG